MGFPHSCPKLARNMSAITKPVPPIRRARAGPVLWTLLVLHFLLPQENILTETIRRARAGPVLWTLLVLHFLLPHENILTETIRRARAGPVLWTLLVLHFLLPQENILTETIRRAQSPSEGLQPDTIRPMSADSPSITASLLTQAWSCPGPRQTASCSVRVRVP
ncbi:hypothetical protein J6590_042088 [Homalodisca vitripennis]|nr:hypothetical protein J6590_042088 [Homalodisca vitripennis]